jgi:hypothetical protein
MIPHAGWLSPVAIKWPKISQHIIETNSNVKEGSQDSLTQKNIVRTCVQVRIHGQWMLPSLMRSFVGQSSIRELCPHAFHELTADMLLPVRYNGTHTHRPLAGQYFSTKRNRSLKRNGRWNAFINFLVSNLSLLVSSFSSILDKIPRKSWIWAYSWGNTFVKMRRIRDKMRIAWHAWDIVRASFCGAGAVFGADTLGSILRGTLHSTLQTLHFTLCTLHCTLHTPHFSLTYIHVTLHTLHCTLNTLLFAHSTLHITLCTSHLALHILHFTLHALYFTLHTTLHTPGSTLYTSHSRLCTLHFALYTPL